MIVPTDTRSTFTTLMVNQVINQAHGTWNIDFLRNFITTQDFETIAATPIGSDSSEDRYIWPLEKSGNYTVRSGYKCNAPVIKPDPSRSSSSHSIQPSLWKSIWKTKAPPKIINFLWKIMVGAFPIFWNLHKRKMVGSAGFIICGNERETINVTPQKFEFTVIFTERFPTAES